MPNEEYAKEFHRLYELSTGVKLDKSTSSSTLFPPKSLDKFVRATRFNSSETVTDNQQQKMIQLSQEESKQDAILTDISSSISMLQETALKIKDEAQLQDTMLTDVATKADKVDAKISSSNSRLVDVLKKVDSKSSMFCSYIVCIVILLGLVSTLYSIL